MGTNSETPLTKLVEECFFRNTIGIPVKIKTTKDRTKDASFSLISPSGFLV